MLETLQLILDIDVDDKKSTSILNYYIQQATQYFLDTTNLTKLPNTAENIIISLVILYWNKQGSEGLNSQNNSGISYTWNNDIPIALKRQIISYRTLRW